MYNMKTNIGCAEFEFGLAGRGRNTLKSSTFFICLRNICQGLDSELVASSVDVDLSDTIFLGFFFFIQPGHRRNLPRYSSLGGSFSRRNRGFPIPFNLPFGRC